MRVDRKSLGLQVAGTLCVSDWTTPVSPEEAASTLASSLAYLFFEGPIPACRLSFPLPKVPNTLQQAASHSRDYTGQSKKTPQCSKQSFQPQGKLEKLVRLYLLAAASRSPPSL